MADLYLTPAEKYTAALGGFYYGDLPEPGTVYTQLIKDILDGSTPDKEPKNILARFIYSLYISDLGDPYPRYELAKLLYWKLHNITPTKSGSVLTVTIDGKEDYMTINTDLSRLWYKVLFGSKTDVITEFPYIFNTIQNKLSDWELFGNTETSGTPTPDSPVMPEGCGERTGNLFDIKDCTQTINNVVWTAYHGSITAHGTTTAISESDSIIVYDGTFTRGGNYINYCRIQASKSIKPPAGTYTFSANANPSNSDRIALIVGDDDTYFANQTARKIAVGETFSVNGNEYVMLVVSSHTALNKYDFADIMLNTGSTPLPYEPYGYKIPISSTNTTTAVYLGEVQSTRKIKKLVLTGENSYKLQSINTYGIANFYYYLDTRVQEAICTHLKSQATIISQTTDEGYLLSMSSQPGQLATFYMRISSSKASTVAELKSYLAQQYANGTPVTVWYVLATPETAVVNEPLMKIGEYADSMSMTQTGIDIPTVVGQNTLDVLTIVKPSSMRIEYTSADETRSRSKRISLLKSPLKKGLIK